MSAEHTIAISHFGVKYSEDHTSGRCPACGKASVVADPEKSGDFWRVRYAHTITVLHDGAKPSVFFGNLCYGTSEHKHKTDAQGETDTRRAQMSKRGK